MTNSDSSHEATPAPNVSAESANEVQNASETEVPNASETEVPNASETEVPNETVPESTDEANTERASGGSDPFKDPTSTADRPHPMQDVTVVSTLPPITSEAMALSAPMQLSDIGKALVGQKLRHFLLEEFVGGGGMGAVFKAVDEQLERTVAVKVLTHRYGRDSDTVRRFRIEAQSAARLNHDNIASVYFVDEDKGWNFIVFEYIDGENIRDLVQRVGPLSIEQATDIVTQVTLALEHAHERDVVHRDIKPSNVLWAADGKVKLVDMGLARFSQVESREDLTVSGVTLGTFDYISPEQGRDPREADVRSDLYSLGCTYYFMLTGHPPYPDGTVLQKLLSHTSDPPPDPVLLRPGIPKEIAAILRRMLAKLPADRYQHPADLIADLAQAAELNDLSIHVTASAPVSAGRAGISNWLRQITPWAVPAATLLAVVLAMSWLWPPKPNQLPAYVLPGQSAAEFSPLDDGVQYPSIQPRRSHDDTAPNPENSPPWLGGSDPLTNDRSIDDSPDRLAVPSGELP